MVSFAANANPQPSGHTSGHSQSADPTIADPKIADTKILTYIDNGWNTLSRSMTDCKSLIDPKVTTAPILYLPAGMETPPAVATAHQQCNVEVSHLPRKITHIGDVRVSEIPVEGLLYLPNRYVVPGGRFNEMYGWDSYFIILGLVENKRTQLAQGMVENFFFEIENYGAILNANRTYFFTRSQPPFLTSMIREVYEHPANKPLSKAWLAKAYSYAQRDYELWTSPIHQAGDTGLARYHDIGEGPVPEMADDSGYYPDVIRWLLAHPGADTGYLVDAPDDPTPAEAIALAKISCDIAASKVCARAHVDGHRLTAGFYLGDRAMRESGFDTSFRFGPFSGSTEDYAPVCLNSLLYKYERDMAHFAALLGRPTEAAAWEHRAATRREAINKYLWNPTQGMFYDYDFTTQKQSTYNYITAFYPLWAKLATPQQAAALQRHLSLFEHDGGLAMSDNNSGTQWDLPFGWAPTNWLAIDGLAQYGFSADASRLAKKFSQTILQNFLTDATIREKYNVVSGSANVAVATGYKSNVVGFGWTNGVYLQMHALLTHKLKQAATLKTEPLTPQPRPTAPSPKDAAAAAQSRTQSHSARKASDYPPPSISRSAYPSLLHRNLFSPAP
jgi:alpha,alpha-trehalase